MWPLTRLLLQPAPTIVPPLLLVLLIVCARPTTATPPYVPLGPFSPLGFTLTSEWNGTCTREATIDVNRGNAASVFVAAAWCQVTGTAANSSIVEQWTKQLITSDYLRRIDVVRTFCNVNGRETDCQLRYSQPWTDVGERELTEPCMRRAAARRDVGAIHMFFFNCPHEPNCAMDWANTHQLGMAEASSWYSLPTSPPPPGFLNPANPGFWYRELQDEQWAGLQFAALNVYGPDIQDGTQLSALNQAMDQLAAEHREATQRAAAAVGAADAEAAEVNAIKVAPFFDSWEWGRAPAPWSPAPNLTQPDDAAATIYRLQWQPFFRQVNHSHLYHIHGRPALWMYNAGTLKPGDRMGDTLALMKGQFEREFGVQPYVLLDIGFDGGGVQDNVFHWDTLNDDGKQRTYTQHNLSLAHSMVKWDSLGRDALGQLSREATDADVLYRMHKGPEILSMVLNETAAVNVTTFATWNDIGEGTGIARQYDLYYQGQWLPPNYFMHLVRQAQCQPTTDAERRLAELAAAGNGRQRRRRASSESG